MAYIKVTLMHEGNTPSERVYEIEEFKDRIENMIHNIETRDPEYGKQDYYIVERVEMSEATFQSLQNLISHEATP